MNAQQMHRECSLASPHAETCKGEQVLRSHRNPVPHPPPLLLAASHQAGIKFPSALAGMFGVFGLLCIVGDNIADKILGLYNPALSWIARWLPLWYVPALVTLPLALQGIPGGGGRHLELPRVRARPASSWFHGLHELVQQSVS